MIEPMELMIGNRVLVDFKEAYIAQLWVDEAAIVYLHSDTGDVASYSDIEPIPLSPELLERCAGFECEYKSNYHTVYYSESLKLSYYFWHIVDKNNQYLQIGALQVPCEHLHALQNLIKTLTGQELKIK